MSHDELSLGFARLLASMIDSMGIERARQEFKTAVASVGLDPDDFQLELMENDFAS